MSKYWQQDQGYCQNDNLLTTIEDAADVIEALEQELGMGKQG